MGFQEDESHNNEFATFRRAIATVTNSQLWEPVKKADCRLRTRSGDGPRNQSKSVLSYELLKSRRSGGASNRVPNRARSAAASVFFAPEFPLVPHSFPLVPALVPFKNCNKQPKYSLVPFFPLVPSLLSCSTNQGWPQGARKTKRNANLH